MENGISDGINGELTEVGVGKKSSTLSERPRPCCLSSSLRQVCVSRRRVGAESGPLRRLDQPLGLFSHARLQMRAMCTACSCIRAGLRFTFAQAASKPHVCLREKLHAVAARHTSRFAQFYVLMFRAVKTPAGFYYGRRFF